MYFPKKIKIDYFQKTFLKLCNYPNSKCKWGCRNKFMVCELKVKPLIFCKEYILCINYEKFWAPRVWIVEPDFTKLNNLKHIFKDSSNRLCLYHTNDWKWNIQEDIINTIIFWAMAWIVYHEDSLITGLWRGPEFDHSTIDSKKNNENFSLKNKKADKPKYLKEYPIRY